MLPAGLGTLAAFILPPNPRDDPNPAVYIWGSHGEESRLTLPRAAHANLATGGDKQLTHRVDCWVVWFGPSQDDGTSNIAVDYQFPAVLDAVMGALRNAPLVDASQHITDPVTGAGSQLLAVGERMTWDYGPVRAVADQRYLRYDAGVNCEVIEVIQA